MTVKQKIKALRKENKTIEEAKECALHGLRKRVVDLHHHLVQHPEYDLETTKVAVSELMFWNDVVCGLELLS